MSQSREELVEIFEKIKQYLPSCFRVVRIHRNVSKKKLARALEKKFAWKNTNLALITGLEHGQCQVSFEQLEHICAALDCGVERLLS